MDANIVCRAREGATLTCREMTWPMRFESFKMESFLSVSREVVMLESSTTQQNLYRIWVLSAGEVLVTIINGRPHVCNHLLPLTFDGD